MPEEIEITRAKLRALKDVVDLVLPILAAEIADLSADPASARERMARLIEAFVGTLVRRHPDDLEGLAEDPLATQVEALVEAVRAGWPKSSGVVG